MSLPERRRQQQLAPRPYSPLSLYPEISKGERDLRSINLQDRARDFALTATVSASAACSWISEQRTAILEAIDAQGWVLLRGLGALTSMDFRKCVTALGVPLMEEYGDLPMGQSDDAAAGVFNVTKYPASKAILFHNEGSHTQQPPRRIFFQCSIAATHDGETPLADSTAVLRALPEEIAKAFTERGLLYRRNFIERFDVSWQQYFRTTERAQVESICNQQNVRAIWQPDGSLTTETLRPAVMTSENGSAAFFNQVLLHHPASLEPEIRRALRNMVTCGRMPRDVHFGDGSPIPDDWIAEVLRAHIKVAVSFRWQPGDIVCVDNFRVAHARRPYQGARQHHVILGR